MKYLGIVILTTLLGSGCTSPKNDNLYNFDVSKSCNLIDWPENFDPRIETLNIDDTLLVSASIFDNGCLRIEGDIDIIDNKVQLLYWKSAENGCKEICEYRLTYKLLNDQNKTPEFELKEKKL